MTTRGNAPFLDYVHKDKARALLNLGHILHLIQDATVPDHTRDDPHLTILAEEISPYEKLAKHWTSENLSVASELIAERQRPIIYSALAEYFDKVATYSNTNFFSKDRIVDGRYKLPEISNRIVKRDGKEFIIGEDGFGNTFLLLAVERKADTAEGKGGLSYSLKDDNYLVLSDYWRLLSRQAVLNGAGVMKLFFDEVEKEKQTLALLEKNKSVLAQLLDAAKEKIAGVFGTRQTDSPAAAAGAAANSATTLTVSENTAARGAALESLRPAATPEKHTDILQNVGMSLRVCYQQHDDKWIICFCNNREVVDNRRTFL